MKKRVIITIPPRNGQRTAGAVQNHALHIEDKACTQIVSHFGGQWVQQSTLFPWNTLASDSLQRGYRYLLGRARFRAIVAALSGSNECNDVPPQRKLSHVEKGRIQRLSCGGVMVQYDPENVSGELLKALQTGDFS